MKCDGTHAHKYGIVGVNMTVCLHGWPYTISRHLKPRLPEANGQTADSFSRSQIESREFVFDLCKNALHGIIEQSSCN